MINEKVRAKIIQRILDYGFAPSVDSNIPKNEKFWHNKWRPAIGWSYMIVCVFDFVIAPIGFTVLSLMVETNASIPSWEPQTLKGNGLYHIAMLTIVGVTAYGRTREKVEGVKTLLKEFEDEIMKGTKENRNEKE